LIEAVESRPKTLAVELPRQPDLPNSSENQRLGPSLNQVLPS
jgi:hypothetical protein